MNQRGNEPMAVMHVRIPVELMQQIESLANQSGLSKSEYVRMALEHARDNDLKITRQVTYQGKVYNPKQW